VIPDDINLCDLVARGGIASREINCHERMLSINKLQPIRLIADVKGNPLNVFNYLARRPEKRFPKKVIHVVVTSMNAEKTYIAALLA
jgi:hypothetical protein